jgi:hypothetical protein
MKILIVTLADEPYWPLAEISVPNKASYAAKHGYDFLYISENWWPHYPASMSKMPVLANKREDYDWVFWTDVDSLIVNPERRLEDYILPSNDQQCIIAYYNQDGLNCGQLLVSDSYVFDEIYRKFSKELDRWAKHPWWEQTALQEYTKDKPYMAKAPESFNRMVISGPEDNTLAKMIDKFQAVRRTDDFILHFAGIGGERAHIRQQLMEWYSGK